MTNPLLALSAVLALLVPPAVPDPPVPEAQHITIRVPRISIARTTIVTRRIAPVAFIERKADKCVKIKRIAGAAAMRMNSIDFVLDDGSLLRARLASNCPALTYYSSFYVRPNEDGKMCAKRDSVRSRFGGECQIDVFRELEPVR